MTDTPFFDASVARATGAHAAPQPHFEVNAAGHPTGNIIQPPGLTRWECIHADVTGFGHALLEMGKVTGRIAGDRKLQEGVELLMTAFGLGAEARDLELVLVQLRHIVETLQAAQAPQPSFQPAPDAPQDM